MKVITKCPKCFHEVTATVGDHFGALVKCYHCHEVVYVEKEKGSEQDKHQS